METFGFAELRGDPRVGGGLVELAGKVFDGRVAVGDTFWWLVSPSGLCSPLKLDVVEIEFYGQLVDEATLGLGVLLRLRIDREQVVEARSTILGCRLGEATAKAK